jgi:hypothetical protein
MGEFGSLLQRCDGSQSELADVGRDAPLPSEPLRRASRRTDLPVRLGISARSVCGARLNPPPALGDALNAGYGYLEDHYVGCDAHQTVALDIVRRPKSTPIHELERYMRCKDCSQARGYPYKRSPSSRLRVTKSLASDPPLAWWPGER